MGEFKGTNCKWELVKDKKIDSKKADYLIITTGVDSKNLFRSIDCASVTNEEMKANSQLISSAPEMLAALEMALEVWGWEHIGGKTHAAVVAAIKKATE